MREGDDRARAAYRVDILPALKVRGFLAQSAAIPAQGGSGRLTTSTPARLKPAAARITLAAFRSRSATWPHASQRNVRSSSGRRDLALVPQQPHVIVE